MDKFFIIRIALSAFAYAIIGDILVNNEITPKTKSYWGVMIVSAILYIMGWFFGRLTLYK